MLVLDATTFVHLASHRVRINKRGRQPAKPIVGKPHRDCHRILQPHLPCSRLLVAIDMARLRRIGKTSNVISLCRNPHWPPLRKGAQFDLYEASVRWRLVGLSSHGSDFVSVLPPRKSVDSFSHALSSQFPPFLVSNVVSVGEGGSPRVKSYSVCLVGSKKGLFTFFESVS